jgi:hypothetical protein
MKPRGIGRGVAGEGDIKLLKVDSSLQAHVWQLVNRRVVSRCCPCVEDEDSGFGFRVSGLMLRHAYVALSSYTGKRDF